jgi:hypothetical protein
MIIYNSCFHFYVLHYIKGKLRQCSSRLNQESVKLVFNAWDITVHEEPGPSQRKFVLMAQRITVHDTECLGMGVDLRPRHYTLLLGERKITCGGEQDYFTR